MPQPKRITRWLFVTFFIFAWSLAIFVCAQGCEWFESKMLAWFGIRSLRDAFDFVKKYAFLFLILHTVWCSLGIAASLQGRRDVVIVLLTAPMWMIVLGMMDDFLHDPNWSAALAVQEIVWFVVVIVAGVYWWSRPAKLPR